MDFNIDKSWPPSRIKQQLRSPIEHHFLIPFNVDLKHVNPPPGTDRIETSTRRSHRAAIPYLRFGAPTWLEAHHAVIRRGSSLQQLYVFLDPIKAHVALEGREVNRVRFKR
jgi:hypothetical protein